MMARISWPILGPGQKKTKSKPKAMNTSRDPSKNPFYLLGPSPRSRDMNWDPWPVKYFKSSALFKSAQDIIKQRNEQDVDNWIDKISLLPASNSIQGVQGRTSNTELYSIRSPGRLPMRIHIWSTPKGKVMVRKGIHSLSLIEFLKTFEIKTWSGLCKDYDFWKSAQISDEFYRQLEIPSHLREAVWQKWWAVNGFKFLELPAELREMVLRFAIGHLAEPYARVYRPNDCLPLRKTCTNLVLVNKQVREEAMPIMLSQVTFLFRKHGQLLRFFEQIPPSSLFALRSLELNFNHETLLDFFGAQVFRHRPSPGYSTSDYYFKDSHFTTSLRLRHIRIYFPHPREHLNSTKLRCACQRTVCLWVWAAARRCLRNIPRVEFEGCIKDDQKKEWLETLALERQGIVTDPEEIESWQMRVWSAESVSNLNCPCPTRND